MLPSWPSRALEYWNPAVHTGCQSGALSSKLLMGQPAPRTCLPDTPALLGRNSGPALLRLAPSARGPAGHSQTDRLSVRTEASSRAAGPGVSAAWRLFSKPAWQNLGTGHSGCSGQGPGGQAPPPTPGGWQTLSRVLDARGPPVVVTGSSAGLRAQSQNQQLLRGWLLHGAWEPGGWAACGDTD